MNLIKVEELAIELLATAAQPYVAYDYEWIPSEAEDAAAMLREMAAQIKELHDKLTEAADALADTVDVSDIRDVLARTAYTEEPQNGKHI